MRRRKVMLWVLGFVGLGLVLPLGVRYMSYSWAKVPWYQTESGPTDLAPDPATTPEAVVQVYGAPTYGWRGVFAVHTWIVMKPENAPRYARREVVGWGGGSVIKYDRGGPDDRWAGKAPSLLVEHRGDAAAALIPQIEAAVQSYPYPDRYQAFPGPNSNTFLAHIARSVPGLGLDLPPSAIGKDFRPLTAPVGAAPSGRGLQVNILGLGGMILSPEEGIEINMLGFGVGVDVLDPALRLPGFGRVPNSS
ncbi:MAG: DUF3750 domain-containing protein [Rhodospirillaceae bacterium]